MYVAAAVLIVVVAMVAYFLYVTRRRAAPEKRPARVARAKQPASEPAEEAMPLNPQDGEDDRDFLLRVMSANKPIPAAGRQFPDHDDSRPEDNQFGGMPQDPDQ